MRYGVVLPNMGTCADVRTLVDLAQRTEAAGWDGLFVWDTLAAPMDDPRNLPACDPWIALGLIAQATTRIRIGTMVTPMSRRRPWKLAREALTVDHLSGGRLILPVGLGSTDDGGYAGVHEELDRRVRAEMLDEGLAILAELWSGEPVTFKGRHHQIDGVTMLPRPVQQPRIPIWVVGVWDRPRSIGRALAWDGILPSVKHADGTWDEPDTEVLRVLGDRVARTRPSGGPFDVVMEGTTTTGEPDAEAHLGRLAAAGVTWWLEAVWELFYEHPESAEPMRARIEAGPPRAARTPE